MRRRIRLARPSVLVLAAFACTTGHLAAQPAPQGVITGYTIDSRQGAVRPVLGIPGSTRLGDPLPVPEKVNVGVFGPGQGLVVSTVGPGNVYLLQNLAGTAAGVNAGQGAATGPSITPLATLIPRVTDLYLNPSATVALLYSAASRRFEWVTNLDTTPVPGPPIPANLLAGAVFTASIASGSSCALVATTLDGGSQIHKLCSDGSIAMVAQLPGAQITSLTWFREDQDALAVDQAGKQILWLQNLSQGPSVAVLAGPSSGLSEPSAVLALDDSTVAVADSGSSSLLVFNTANAGALQTFVLPEVPTRLVALSQPGVLACTQTGSRPLLLVDTRHNYAPFFVPMN